MDVARFRNCIKCLALQSPSYSALNWKNGDSFPTASPKPTSIKRPTLPPCLKIPINKQVRKKNTKQSLSTLLVLNMSAFGSFTDWNHDHVSGNWPKISQFYFFSDSNGDQFWFSSHWSSLTVSWWAGKSWYNSPCDFGLTFCEVVSMLPLLLPRFPFNTAIKNTIRDRRVSHFSVFFLFFRVPAYSGEFLSHWSTWYSPFPPNICFDPLMW